jgi:hypothetical protein
MYCDAIVKSGWYIMRNLTRMTIKIASNHFVIVENINISAVIHSYQNKEHNDLVMKVLLDILRHITKKIK